ncbi:mediator of RNA polymerase II transcription subunit 8-like [Panonychus citri]|uniref:mediator of RNA polymerase II transcription subunit 8-like n=1 Tax=Panonychus citri TaxID=50023 RepID=UPI002307AE35|nr:mediator of RNA polymerase II transcription subunit 8-like [Panonychus citri]
MMEREEKVLDIVLESLISRCQEIKKSLISFLYRLENDYQKLDWPAFLDNFALISGQINNMMKILKNEKTPPLRNRILLPLLLAPDRDEDLATLTEGRVVAFNHEMVPDYLRTKLEPEIEAIEAKLSAKAMQINPETGSKHITSVNKIANHILELIKNIKEDWESESSQRTSIPVTSSIQDTNTILAAIYLGKGLKPVPTMVPKPGPAPGVAMGPQGPNQTGPRPPGMGKAPSAIKTNIKSASQNNPYNR